MRDVITASLPHLITSATVVAVLIAIAVKRRHRPTASITLAGIGAALLAVLPAVVAGDSTVVTVTDLLVIDGAARLGMALILVATLGVLTLCRPYFDSFTGNREELYLLIGVGTLGALTLATAQHAASLLLGLELLSLPMVAGVAYAADRQRAIESGVKYLVLSAAASATLLFGIALIYADTGSLDLTTLGAAISRTGVDSPLVATGAAMLLAGLAFKLSLAPFHQWTPDVYEGAPLPVAAYLATVAKIGALIATVRVFHASAESASPYVLTAVAGLSMASMLVGSVLAVRQTNLKRLLAYSSIAHFGYLALLLVVPGRGALVAAGVYVSAYVITSLGVFGVLSIASSPMAERDREQIDDYRGLFWQRPYLAAILIAMLLSLAGMPLTAGFFSKLVIVGAGVGDARWWLVGAVLVSSLISAYYYLRVIGAVVSAAPAGVEPGYALPGWSRTAAGLMVLLAMAATVWLGVYPQPLFVLGELLRVP
jgi:NADH-quinone oxidoreductase subunit N